MNRRDLLKYLLATPLAATLDYEKLLWIPDEKKIFVFPSNIDWGFGEAWVYIPSAKQIEIYKELGKLVFFTSSPASKSHEWLKKKFTSP